MLKDFKGQLAITKPKERHRQMREEKKNKTKLRAFILTLSWKIDRLEDK